MVRSVLLSALFVLGLPTVARADVIFNALAAANPGITGNAVRAGGSAPLGLMTFGTATTISAIGIYDATSATGTQTFLIFDHGTGALLYKSAAKLFASDGGTAIGFDSYKVSDTFSFTFQPGTTYAIGATSTVTTGYYYSFNPVTQNGITLGANNDNVIGTTAQGVTACCSTGIELFVASETTSVPEPASLALLGGGLVAVGAARRRRPGS